MNNKTSINIPSPKTNDINEIIKLFKEKKVKLIKYNQSLDKEVQDCVCYDGYMQLSQDEKELLITIKKPVKEKFGLESDYNEAILK